MTFRSPAQRKYVFATRPKGAKLSAKKKPKFVINNKIKAFGQMNTKNNVIEINKKKHKGDKKQLADTIKHELYHVHHPKAQEKTVYKKTGKLSNMTTQEQNRLIAKLRQKKMNYKIGATKRKLHMKKEEKVEPGTLISNMNAQKGLREKALPSNASERASLMGAI